MISSEDLESLIAAKKREIQKEKALLGLVPFNEAAVQTSEDGCPKQVTFQPEINSKVVEENGADHKIALYELEEQIPAGLERYIRRYIGLPVMLKAGEFSPNNPLIRGDRPHVVGDALLGLGEYERRRNTLRKIRQAQYREYLDRQAKKKQEAKEEAERERRELEQRERDREERERQLVLERERYQSPERRRASVSWPGQYETSHVSKVDSATQVDGQSRPLSVGVQTEDAELYRLSLSPSKLTEAERELSPRTVGDTASWNKWDSCERRRSYGDFDERTSSIKKTNRDKLHSDLRHSYMPSIFDADAIQLRNMQTEKDAAERRQFYQQELKNQIMEQQRIREERKSREKLLEQAEMRRLEEQLRMLRLAQESERDKQHHITAATNFSSREYETKRKELQRDIELETQKLRVSSHPGRNLPKLPPNTSKSDSKHEKTFQPVENKPYSFNIPDNSIFSANYDVDSYLRKNLNFKNKNGVEILNDTKDYREFNDVDKYKNNDIEKYKNNDNIKQYKNSEYDNYKNTDNKMRTPSDDGRKFVVEKALIHEPKERKISKPETYEQLKERKIYKPETYEQLKERKIYKPETYEQPTERKISKPETYEQPTERKITKPETLNYEANLSVPILRHSPKKLDRNDFSPLSDAMKKVDDKWKVPVVQKNILKSIPNEEGRNVSILTQLGSIRRQLQLEQLKLDKMLTKNDT